MLSLNTPYSLNNGVTIKNRIVKSAMSEQLGNRRHDPGTNVRNLYRRWALGGAALCITGHIMVDRHALSEPGNIVLDELSDRTAFSDWAKAATDNHTHIWPQLNHPGKQSPNFLSSEPLAPSAIPLKGSVGTNFRMPRAMTEAEIHHVIEKFATSAKLAKELGFTGVQIHGAHGYLINQFLSPRHNHRQDQWGGCLDNRMRFLIEVYRAIRHTVGKGFPVALKLNSADFMKGGFTEEESMQVVKTLANEGVDLIEISGGSYEKVAFIDGKPQKESTRQREAYFLDYAENVRKITNIPLLVTGGFRSQQAMASALNSQATDFIGLARALAIDPDFPNKLLHQHNSDIEIPARSTGLRLLDRMVMIDVLWYQQQMIRIANNLEPKPNMSEWIALWHSLRAIGLHAFRRLRA